MLTNEKEVLKSFTLSNLFTAVQNSVVWLACAWVSATAIIKTGSPKYGWILLIALLGTVTHKQVVNHNEDEPKSEN